MPEIIEKAATKDIINLPNGVKTSINSPTVKKLSNTLISKLKVVVNKTIKNNNPYSKRNTPTNFVKSYFLLILINNFTPYSYNNHFYSFFCLFN